MFRKMFFFETGYCICPLIFCMAEVSAFHLLSTFFARESDFVIRDAKKSSIVHYDEGEKVV